MRYLPRRCPPLPGPRQSLVSSTLRPPGGRFTSAEDRSKLERFQRKMQRLQFLSSDIEPLTMMAEAADVRLLRAVTVNDAHVLRSLFPPTAQRHYNMRPRSHPFQLPAKDDRNFIPRILYKIR